MALKSFASKSSAVQSPSTEAARIQRLRDWIIAADKNGSDKSELVLRLTIRDCAALKRHPSVQSDEIAFTAGAMHFLGVRVVEGGVADSLLETDAPSSAV